jgi:two-component system capsular synthesis response regulator RcsB
MIRKVLIAEDHESANISVQKTLEELKIDQPDHVYYCDEALERIVKAKQRDQSYDLLITDLSFEEEEGRPQKITSGTALIEAARQVQPDLKVLVFSATSQPATLDMLYNNLSIDGYVRKARNDAKELKQAIEQIARHQQYLPRKVMELINQKNAHNFSDFDIRIITLLVQGIQIKDIPSHLKQKKIHPSGLSSVEKRLKLIKDAYSFSNNEQLVAYCQKRGII